MIMRTGNYKTVLEDGGKQQIIPRAAESTKSSLMGFTSITSARPLIFQYRIIYLERSMNKSAFVEQIVYISFFTYTETQTG